MLKAYETLPACVDASWKDETNKGLNLLTSGQPPKLFMALSGNAQTKLENKAIKQLSDPNSHCDWGMSSKTPMMPETLDRA